MKKKIVAFGLVLVLALAMMVPVFAANIPSGLCSYCGTALQTSASAYHRTDLEKVNDAHHYLYYIGYGICPRCANTGEMVYSRKSEPHYSNNCPCGFSYRMINE